MARDELAPLALDRPHHGPARCARSRRQFPDCTAVRRRERNVMTEAEFRALAAQGYNRIPLVLESFADLDTPLSLYVKLANAPYTFLLESVVGGERFGRYSFIGLPAKVRIRARDTAIEVDSGGSVVGASRGRSARVRRRVHARYRAAPRPGLPRFCGGLAGYFGYDTVRHIETKLAGKAPPAIPGLAEVPDIFLVLTEELAVVDNLAGKIYLIVYADPKEPDAYGRARERLQTLRRKLREPVSIPFQTAETVTQSDSEFGANGYQGAVRRAKEYIAAGDVMQVVLSQRMRRPFASSPLSLYRALRSLNPSPYMFYYDFGDFHVVGASPEILVRKEGSTVTLRPIAGTRPARRRARRRRSARARAPRRSEGNRRARDARRSRDATTSAASRRRAR
jgi:anthranilate synthase component 1